MFSKFRINSNNKFIYLAIGSVCAAFIYPFFIPGDTEKVTVVNTDLAQNDVINILEEKKKWSERLNKSGAEKAYTELKEELYSKKYDQQHSIAHLFGGLVYEKLDIKGVGVCDGSFGFGCFHGFFTVALAKGGVKMISEMDAECFKKFGSANQGCQHGIGHGIMEYRGHANLAKALEDCKLTNQTRKVFGCTSGVFMEYNIPILLGTEEEVNITARKYDKNNPYYPCTDVQDEFRESCYFELSQWWKNIFNNFESVGKLCDKINDRSHREICFIGLGNIVAPSVSYDAGQAITECQKMPGREGEILCRAGTAWGFFSNPEARPHFRDLCEGVKTEETAMCMDKADLVGNHGKTFNAF